MTGLKTKIKRYVIFSEKLPDVLSRDPKDILNVIVPIKEKLKKVKKLVIVTFGAGFEGSCFFEVIRTLMGSLHFTKDITFFVKEGETEIEYCALLDIC